MTKVMTLTDYAHEGRWQRSENGSVLPVSDNHVWEFTLHTDFAHYSDQLDVVVEIHNDVSVGWIVIISEKTIMTEWTDTANSEDDGLLLYSKEQARTYAESKLHHFGYIAELTEYRE